jgi:hypothetical protein
MGSEKKDQKKCKSTFASKLPSRRSPEVREADALAAGDMAAAPLFLPLHWGFLLLVCPKDCLHCDLQQETSGYCERKEANQFRTAGNARSIEI